MEGGRKLELKETDEEDSQRVQIHSDFGREFLDPHLIQKHGHTPQLCTKF